jgi:hypothetical protein
MNVYGILTRYGDYFEVSAASIVDARADAEDMIAVDGQVGDSVHQVHSVANPVQAIREDLAEIMAS